MKNRSYNIMIVAMVVITAMSIMLILYLDNAHKTFEGDIEVNEFGVTETVIPVRDLTLTPGDIKDYEVNVFCRATGSYHVTVDFLESRDGKMKHFVNVRILAADEQIYEGTLKELIDEKPTVIFDAVLDESEPTVLTFIYEMPVEIGNEAQGTFSDFDIHVNIKKN